MKIAKALFVTFLFCGAWAQAAEPVKWTGFYVGLEVAHRSVTADWTATQTYNPDGSSPAYFNEGNVVTDAIVDIGPDHQFKPKGTAFGVRFGYDAMLSPTWLIGGDVRYIAGSKDETIDWIPGLATTPGELGPSTSTVEAKNTAQIRARVGYLVQPKTLVYGTLGFSQQKLEAGTVCPSDTYICNPEFGTRTGGASKNLTGFTVGVGLEYAVAPKWHLAFEYNYAKYGDFNFVALQWEEGASYGADAKIATKSGTFTLGALYRF